jgi:hypothetical protein
MVQFVPGSVYQRLAFSRKLPVAELARVPAIFENHGGDTDSMCRQDELRRLFRKYGIEFDERYVWD